MDILHYTNRFNLILDIIFRPKMFKNELLRSQQEEIDNLVKDFTKRLDMIGYDQYKNGIVKNPTKNTIALCKIPVVGKTVVSEDEIVPKVSVSVEHKNIYPISVSYMSDKITTSEIKQIFAEELAKTLIQEDFVQIQVVGNELICTINAF